MQPRTHVAALIGLALSSLAFAGSAAAQSGWLPGTAFDSFIAGSDSDGSTLRLCRSTDPAYGGPQPGKSRDSWGACAIGFGNKEAQIRSYETLRPVWTTQTAGRGLNIGQPNFDLAVCRARLGGGIHVGERHPGDTACFIPFGGSVQRVTNFEVLIATDGLPYHFRPEQGTFQPIALIAGIEANGVPLYACRAVGSDGLLHAGKTRRDWRGCNIPVGNREETIQKFWTLVLPFLPVPDPTDPSPAASPFSDRPMYVGGRDVDGSPLGVCVAWWNNSGQAGKYRPSANTCNIGYAGKEYPLPVGFSVLRTR